MKDMEGSGHGLFYGTIRAFAWKNSRKSLNTCPLVCGKCNDAVSSSDYIVSNKRMNSE
jgi:hypothetical protein